MNLIKVFFIITLIVGTSFSQRNAVISAQHNYLLTENSEKTSLSFNGSEKYFLYNRTENLGIAKRI